jgi:hypothetical protein
MKTYTNCGQLFVEDDLPIPSTAKEFSDIFIESTSSDRRPVLCPRCKEELGMMNLMGLGK